jgi:hypothetical protein
MTGWNQRGIGDRVIYAFVRKKINKTGQTLSGGSHEKEKFVLA